MRSHASLKKHLDFKDPECNSFPSGEVHLSVTSGETIYSNARIGKSNAVLSIASPYFRDDPTAWLDALSGDVLAPNVEIVLVDDGTGDSKLDAKVRLAIEAWPGPATLVRFHANQGRARARNRAIKAARGTFILFIDADMLPGDDQFLSRYLDAILNRRSAIIFGGFTPSNVNIDHDTMLNHALAAKDDCKLASQRAIRGAIAVASNNLLVRRDVFARIPFDDGFEGWGWEDTEWAMRAVFAGYGLTHIDNPAVHVGLDTTSAMLRKYKEAGRNLRRLLDSHPEAGHMAGVKAANALTKIPGHAALRPLSAWMARDPLCIVPLSMRGLALKYWRASHAAEAFTSA